jgi:hypothetical protein
MKAYSRVQFLRRGAAAAGGIAGLGLVEPLAAFGRSAGDPNPIPGGFDENFNFVAEDPFIHVLPPGLGFEMATITDFNGIVGAAETQGTAHGSDGSAYSFDTDMRFMRGTYVDVNGRVQNGAFGFI